MGTLGSFSVRSLRAFTLVGALVLMSCKGDSATSPPKPASIVFIGNNVLTGTVGQALGSSLQIEIRDDRGQPVPNIPFTVSVSSGSIAGAPEKTAVGTTSLGTWTLGTTAGSQTLTVQSGELSPLMLSATAAAGTASIANSGGVATTGQGTPGAMSPLTPQIRLSDAFGNPISGATVTALVEGGGSVQFPNPVTNANGVASVGAWTLGSQGGVQRVTLQASGVAAVVFTTEVGGQFAITLRYIGAPPAAEIQAAFESAVSRITQVITGDIADLNISAASLSQCAPGQAVSEFVDDLLIFVNVRTFDGPGGLLGQAGPCLIRVTGGLPVVGRMEFDVADLNTLLNVGSLPSTILHEMLHVVGFGTLWSDFSLLQGAGGANPLYMGAQGFAAYQFLGGIATGIAVENCVGIPGCGQGTRDSHWRENSFGAELMTGFLNPGFNPLGRFSVAALGDLGYIVSLAGADPFQVTGNNLFAPGGAPPTHIREILMRPVGAVDAAGMTVPNRR